MMYLFRRMKISMKHVLACGRKLCGVINTACRGIVSLLLFNRNQAWGKFIVLIHRAAPLLLQGVMHGPCKFNNSALGCLGHLGLSH